MPAASAISCSEVRRPEEAMIDAAERRISVRRLSSAVSAAASTTRVCFAAVRRFGITPLFFDWARARRRFGRLDGDFTYLPRDAARSYDIDFRLARAAGAGAVSRS